MRLWLKIVIIAVLVLVVAFLGLSAYLGNSMTGVERLDITETPLSYGLYYEEVSFPSRVDELNLSGWYLPAEDGRAVIIMVHGAEQHRADPTMGMLGIAAGLVEHGYSVLMFDLRGHGESEGERMSAGYFETRDLGGAVDYVKARGFDEIGVLGFSVGGVTALLTAADCQDIDVIVSDSAFADLNDMLEPQFAERSGFPTFFLKPLLAMVKFMYGVDFTAVKPVAVVAEIYPRPIFFIQGELDDTVPPEHVYQLYDAADNPRNELWVLPDAGHVEAYSLYPDEYMSRVTAFFDEVLR